MPTRTACLLLALLAGCAGRNRWPAFSTQQYPEPMPATVEVLEPGAEAAYPPGPEEVIIRRLADPVQLQEAGQHAAFRLRYFDKRRRVSAGSWVYCEPGGRAEVLWPESGTTVMLFDTTVGVVGSPSRGEPGFLFKELQRADLMLNPGDQIELPGGALLTADSGPWVLQRRSFEVLRVKNQSKVPGELAFREEVFVLAPGETIDLPLLSAGGAPIPPVPGVRTLEGPGFDLTVFGEVEVSEVPGGFELVGRTTEHEIAGLGVRLHLAPGEVARFGGLESVAPAAQEEPVESAEPVETAGPAESTEASEED
jgi:hypothetical protein